MSVRIRNFGEGKKNFREGKKFFREGISPYEERKKFFEERIIFFLEKEKSWDTSASFLKQRKSFYPRNGFLSREREECPTATRRASPATRRARLSGARQSRWSR